VRVLPVVHAKRCLSTVDRPVQVDADALASQVAERQAVEEAAAQRDRCAPGPSTQHTPLGGATLLVKPRRASVRGKHQLVEQRSALLKAGPKTLLRRRAVPRGVTLQRQVAAWLTLDGSAEPAQTLLLTHVQSAHLRACSTQPACRAGARRSRRSRRRQQRQRRLRPRPLSAAPPRARCWRRSSGRRPRRARVRWLSCAGPPPASGHPWTLGPRALARISATAGAHSSLSGRGCSIRWRTPRANRGEALLRSSALGACAAGALRREAAACAARGRCGLAQIPGDTFNSRGRASLPRGCARRPCE